MTYGEDVRTPQEKQHWLCQCCSKDTWEEEKDYYMLKDHIWKKIASDPDGMMCMDCVEEKLGHKLTADDILICPLTELFNSYTREILYKAKVIQ